MEVVRGSEGEEEEEEEWEEAEEGAEVDDVGAQDDDEEDITCYLSQTFWKPALQVGTSI